MTTTERTAKHRHTQTEEIRLLRRALLDALTVFDIGENTQFRLTHADIIARANSAKLTDKTP